MQRMLLFLTPTDKRELQPGQRNSAGNSMATPCLHAFIALRFTRSALFLEVELFIAFMALRFTRLAFFNS